jgi:CheY-like chemotaxis protein
MSDSFAAGAVAFLSKPLTLDKLQTALRMLLRSAQTHKAA